VVRDLIDGLSQAELAQRTGAPLTFARDVRVLTAPALADDQ
jgi:hypothetical protein